MKRTIFMLVFALLAMLANAVTISGNIQTDSLKALPFASVYVKDAYVGTTTNLDGNYRISGLSAGHHTLVVSYLGYETQTIELNLSSDEVHDFVMHEQAITLNNVFVTPTGESIERYILSQTVKNIKWLEDYFVSFDCDEVFRFEQRNNKMGVAVEQHRKTLNFLLGLLGMKGFFNTILDHPDLNIEMIANMKMAKGKVKTEKVFINSCSPQLNDNESKAMTKVFSWQIGIYHDTKYGWLADIKKDLEKMDKKEPGESEKHLKYKGSYDEGGKTIHIIQYNMVQYHIVDGVWKLRRCYSKNNKKEYNTEFQELANGVYLPVAYNSDSDLDIEELLKNELKKLKEKDTSKMKAKKLEQHESRIAELEAALKQDIGKIKFTSAYNYTNFVLKD